MTGDLIIEYNEPILITGSGGFLGMKVVESLLRSGFRNLRCFVRSGRNTERLRRLNGSARDAEIHVLAGDLLSRSDCQKACGGVRVVLHLAAGIEKTFAGSFLNTVVATRNLLDAVTISGDLRRFLCVSSLAVYSNSEIGRREILDENCSVDEKVLDRHEAYAFAKLEQERVLEEYAARYGLPYVIVRPGPIYGPGKREITARVGINPFGVFLHLGGGNRIPVTYVDNCAEAVVLAGTKKGVDGQVFNVVDDDLPLSREFLRRYKEAVGGFRSLRIPYSVFRLFCALWEKYARWSEGQLPPVFNRRRCAHYWKGNRFSNEKLKRLVGWEPRVPTNEAIDRYCEWLRNQGRETA